MSKFLGKLNAFNLAYKNLCIFRNLNSGKCGNIMSSLTYYLCIESAVYDYSLSYLVKLLRVENIAASVGKFLFYFIVYLVKDYNRLLGSAYHAVIKRL